MRKNWIVLSCMAFVLSLLLVGCRSNSSSKSAGGENSNRTITVGFWKGDSTVEDKARKQMFADFTKDSGIKIKEKVYNDYATQLMTDLVGGTAPDAFYVDASELPSLAKQGVLEPLDSYIKKSKLDVEDYYTPLINAFKYTDNKLYGLPKDYSTLGFYYNETLLEKAGMTKANIPKDFDDLESFLTKLKKALPDNTPMVFSPLLAREMYIAESEGGKIVKKNGLANLNDKKVVNALQPIVELYKKGLIKTTKDLGDGYAGDTFGRGQAVISDEGAWLISHLDTNFSDLKYGTTELPILNGKKRNMVFTVSYSMNSSSKNKAEAWKFIEYTATSSVMKKYATAASVVPTKKSVAKSMDITKNKNLAPFVAAADYATPWQDGEYLTLITARYENMIPSALKGEMTLQKAMDEATTSANKDIKEQMK